MLIIIILQSCMFYGNANLLQANLHTDLNLLIKNVKAREDQHLTLLQYNQTLFEKLGEMDSIPFFQQELNKHRSFLHSIQEQHQILNRQQKQMISKYQSTSSSESSITKLFGRVIARVIEVLHHSLQKSKVYDKSIQPNLLLLKHKLVELTTDKTKVDIQQTLQTIINYVKVMVNKQIEKLDAMVKMLTQGDFSKFKQISRSNEEGHKNNRIVMKTSSAKSKNPINKISINVSRQKFEKKKQELQQRKKIKKKLAQRMFANFYDTMDLSKPQFMEDMVFPHPEPKKIQLYNDILIRNKANQTQISDFQAKRDHLAKKIQIFKETMQKESRNIGEVLNFIKSRPTEKVTIVNTPQLSNKKHIKIMTMQNQQQSEEANITPIIPELARQLLSCQFQGNQRRRGQISNPDKPAYESICNSMRSTQQELQHLKLRLSQQQSMRSRSRFPNIYGRFSIDSGNKHKQTKKSEKRNNILKNVEIELPLNNEHHGILEKKVQTLKKPDEGFKQKLNEVEFTFYARKQTNKFPQFNT